MTTNFFSQIANLAIKGTLRINIQPQAEGNLLVSVLLADDKLKDKAMNVIPPLVLKGNSIDLDEGFFNAIKTPIQQTSSLITNLRSYELSQDKAVKESRQEKEKETTVKKEKDGIRKKFDEQMKKVEDLEKQKKIGEAIGQLPDVKLYAEYADEIKKKGDQLRSQHRTLSLFDEPTASSEIEEPSETEVVEEEEEQEEDFTDDNDQTEEEEEENDYQ